MWRGAIGSLVIDDDFQVLLGFMLPAYLTLILVILKYIFNHEKSANNIDRRFIDLIKPRAWKALSKIYSEIWAQSMEASVLLFSDIQILTGLAILITGYIQLGSGIISWNWEVVVSLAWFSSLTHLATLSSLRDYFRNRPAMAICRAAFMGISLILLIVAYGTTGYVTQFHYGPSTSIDLSSLPADCLLSPNSWTNAANELESADHAYAEGFNIPLVVISIIFLLVSYSTRILTIFKPSIGLAGGRLKMILRNRIRRPFLFPSKRAQQSPVSVHSMRLLVLAVVYVISKALSDIGGSTLWEVCLC